MSRVLIIQTGGTIMMAPHEVDSSSPPSTTLVPSALGRDLLAELPTLGRVADIETHVLSNLDSGDMQPSDWVMLTRSVHSAIESRKYDGIVVLHGTDTMAYTASALALMLGPLPCPVVLTGAQRPLGEVRTDARENVIDAALLATLAVPEVLIAFSARGLRGARATKQDAWAFGAFDTPNCRPLVELGVGVELASHILPPRDLLPFDGRIEPRVLVVRVFPGIDPTLVSVAVRAGVRGLVLEAYGTGNMPHLAGSLIPAIEEASALGVPVLVVSQCPRGFVQLSRYAGGAAAARAGAISGGDMTVEAAVAKLMIGLGRYRGGDALTSYLTRDIVGELTPASPASIS